MSFCVDLIVTRMEGTDADRRFGRCELVRLFNSLEMITRAVRALRHPSTLELPL
jgi:hypothetical protein